MSDPIADALLDHLVAHPDPEPCLHTLAAQLIPGNSLTDEERLASLALALNSGFRKGYWQLVITPGPDDATAALRERVWSAAEALAKARASADGPTRIVAPTDVDKPEGMIVVKMSETIRQAIVSLLREAAGALPA